MKTLMMIAWLTGGAADGVSTHVALERGGREVVLSQSSPINTAIISGEMAGGAYGLNKLYKSHPKVAVSLGIAAGVFRSGIAAHNLRVTR